MARKFITGIAVVALSFVLAAAQGPPPGHGGKRGDKDKDSPPVQAPGFVPTHPHGPMFRGPGPHMGDWLRRNESLPPDQQIRKLEENPDFRRLPPDRQQRLRQRLQNFSNLPPEQKQRILNNMERYEHLPPDQQQRLHEMFHQFRDLPSDRKEALRHAFQQLEGLPPDQRQRLLDSAEYRNSYSDQERGILRGMSTIGITPNPRPPQH